MANMAPLRCADTNWPPLNRTPAGKKGLQVRIEGIFETARLRRDLLGFPLLGVVFSPTMVGEMGDSVTTQAKLALGSTQKECVHASSVERDECLCSGFLSSLLF